jgi:hypothetical protein
MESSRLIKPTIIIIILGLGTFMAPLTGFAQRSGAADFFIEAEIDNPTPYLGQQITYTLNRYQAVDFPNPPYYEDHPFIGFWHTYLIQRPPFTTIIDGREYRVHQTHIALFPTRPGTTVLDPARLVIPSDGPEANLILESQPIRVIVRSLPDNPPSNFKGAVGQFEISARLNETQGKINQLMSLTVEIRGAGNVETMIEPTLPDLPNWRVLENEVKTDIPLSREVVQGSRQFIWTVTPRKAGQQEIPPISFSYYDPQNQAYYTISSDPIPVTILPDESEPAGPIEPGPVVKQEVERLGGDIRHIKPVPAELYSGNLSLDLAGYLGCTVIPLLAVGGAWVWQRRRHRSPELRRRQAGQMAKKALSVQHPHSDAVVIVRQTFLNYLSEKLERPVTGLTLDQFVGLLEETNIAPELIERVRELLAQLESDRFAPPGVASPASSQTLRQSAYKLVEDLEKAFPRL